MACEQFLKVVKAGNSTMSQAHVVVVVVGVVVVVVVGVVVVVVVVGVLKLSNNVRFLLKIKKD